MEYIYSRWTISKIAAVIFAYVGKLKIDYVSRPDMGSRGDTRADMEKVMYWSLYVKAKVNTMYGMS